MSYVEEGTKARKTASTLQNPSSSRSHALLTVNLSQETSEQRPDANDSSRRQDAARASSSRLHLVDLAGSESAATCSGVHRLKEGANINKSLVALGNVISALAERGSTGTGPGKRYIPYRDSSLTWLLKDALGGNATTIMLATISPASGSYNETAHTLRFAQRAQSVVNRPMVNEDPVERIIRELKAEIARLKSLLLEKDIDGNTQAPCCCGKAQSSKYTTTELSHHEEQISSSEKSDRKDESKDEKSLYALSLRRSNSSDSVTTCETGSSGFIRRFSSCDLQSSDRFNYNRAKITELNDEEDEVVDEINEPVFVDIPTLVAVLIKPDDSLQESSTQIEEICSDEVQEDSIDTDFIEGGNEEFEESEKIDYINSDDRSNLTNLCNGLKDTEIGELHHQISPDSSPRSPSSVGRNESRGKFSKQNSIDLPSSNLNVSRKFGSIEGISKRKEPILSFQRSHTNLEKHSSLADRGKKLNNIREIDDHKASTKSGNIWKAIGNKDLLQRKSSNESDKSLKESSSGRTSGYVSNIGRKPSLENLKRKTSKDSSSSSSKEEQILISNLTRDKLLRRKNSLEQEATTTSGGRYHTAIQRVKRSEIVAAVTERLYSSRKQPEESMDIRSPPEGIDTKVSNNLVTRSKLQDISRKMLLRRRRVNVDTQTEAASTLRLKDTASLTDDEPKVVLQDAAILTDDHTDVVATTSTQRLPVLRVKDMATLTDRRPQTDIFRCKDVGCLANDLDFDDYELHSSRNDSGVLSDDTQNYESNLSSAEVFELSPEGDKKVPYADSSTNTSNLVLSGKDSAMQTVRREVANRELTNQKVVNQKVTDQRENSENRSCGHCCSLIHQHPQCLVSPPTNSIEKNIISISLPDMINITIESTNGLESRIAVTDGDTASDTAEEKPKSIYSDKESQTSEIKCEESSPQDPAVRSTAVQADGRVFRIENIFQDTRTKNCYDAVSSDSRREVATKKSVTLRNSRGTEYSSVIEMTENGAETEWDEMQPVEKIYQTKRPIVKSLTQAFIAKRRSYSASPERTAYEFIGRDSERPNSSETMGLWKNWTLPYSQKLSRLIDCYSRETQLPAQRDTKVEQADHFSTSTMSNEYTHADQISNGTVQELSDQNFRLDKSEKLKSVSINSLLGYDCNFSDDSLDRDEDNFTENVTDKNVEDSEKHEKYESLCPPDVVAHTKKEISKSTSHADSIGVESVDNDFDDNEVSLPKKKLTEISDKKSPIQDYKALILGTSSYVAGSDSEEETTAKAYNQSDIVSRKKVSFSEPSSPEEITDTLATSRNTLTPRQNSLKSIIKKIKPVTENSNVARQNIETDRPLRKKEVESARNEKISSAFDGNRDSENSEESLNDHKAEISNEDYEETCNESDNTVNSDEDICYHMIPRRNILEEYLNEAMTFMRNMNSINEYMSATSMLDSYKKHRRRRRGNRGNRTNMDKNYMQYRGRKVSLKDDTDKYLKPSKDDIVAAESYEKCIRGIERLEACIDRVSKHNQVLQDRYSISVESAGAKSGLAKSSIDSKLFSSGCSGDNVIRRCGKNAVVENGADSCDESSFSRISSPFLSSIQTQDVTRRSALNGTEKYGEEIVGKFGKRDLDERNNNVTSDDDLERKIFRQLMSAVDSRKCRNPRREKHLRKITDLGSQSPTTYSKVWEAFRQDASGIINFDEVSVAGDYLGDIRGIESSLEDFKRTKLSDAEDTDSKTDSVCSTVDFEETCYDRNKLSKRNDNLPRIEMPSESTRYSNCTTDHHSAKSTGQTFNVEEDIALRNTHIIKDSLKIEPTNSRLDSPLELKYPSSPRAKFLELLRERRRIVENSRSANAF
ncbi:centromere-associated protein E-like isoform X2 [Pseudomyrmex gracilis]|nr:centromere-associated protein E-like isoform X2 [Pseudomyrmex gracilis]XP_020289996.1 centromere-associated protein E-like isoform X2 [Pseudomyrmex gracilis]